MTRIVTVMPTEAQDQIKLVVWLRNQGIKVAASANGGKRAYAEGVKLQRMGVSAGFPDLCIPLPIYPYHGLFLELKREKGGQVSDEQRYWLDYLNKMGYMAKVTRGLEDAKRVV